MTLLVLNRRPIAERIPRWLADLSEDLVLITAATATPDEIPARVRDSYREVIVLGNYDAPDVERLIVEVGRRHKVRRIVSSTETDVLRAARARVELGVPGQTPQSASAYRDKAIMKRTLHDAGVSVRVPVPVGDATDLRGFGRDHGFPIVVKPSDGAGSVGVTVLDGPTELERWLSHAPDSVWPNLVAETWLDGIGYHVDGLMAGGRIIECWPSRYRHTNLDSTRYAYPFSSWMLAYSDPLGDRLREQTALVVQVLPPPTEVTAFHAEFFRTEDDKLVLGEIACRPGGGGIVIGHEHATGVNLHAASYRGQAGVDAADLIAGGTASSPTQITGFVWFPPAAAILTSLPQSCPVDGVFRYQPTGRIGTRYEGPRSISDHVAEVFVSASATTDLEPVMARVENWWSSAVSWSDGDGAPVPAPGPSITSGRREPER